MKDLSFFLGANTYHGFYSLYEDYLDHWAGSRVYILKGGAGCGKSGFMRTVGQRASAAGHPVCRILCSGDPSSLDGIHIPDLGVILLDGTAPHVLEPPLVGDKGFYLDLSRFYHSGVPDLRDREKAYKEHYRRAYRWLAAAGEADASLTIHPETETYIRKKAVSLITRELHVKSRKAGGSQRIFTDAFTGEGMLSLSARESEPAKRRISLRGICGSEHVFLASAAETAAARGWDIVLALSPLDPRKIAHLYIPENDLILGIGEGNRCIHLDKVIYRQAGREESMRIRETESMRLALLSRARKELELAHHHHDLLEEAVNPYVDFSGVYELAESFAADLLKGTVFKESER